MTIEYSTRQVLAISTVVIVLVIILSILVWRLVVNAEDRKKKRLQFALLAFQSHTNPHFIKNVLQAINWFILNNDKTLASNYLCDFSRLMEDILKFSKKNFVTLAEKIEFLNLYIKLQHVRYKDKFDYIPIQSTGKQSKATIQVEEQINPEEFLLPPLLIHPFIENAIEHGLKPKKNKGELTVKFVLENNSLLCIITDDGIGRDASMKLHASANTKRSNIGLANTHKRIEIIKQLYHVNIEVTIQDLYTNQEETGTKVSIYFPLPLNEAIRVYNYNPYSGASVQIEKSKPDYEGEN